MFINATGFYVPEERVDNQHFLELNGLTSEWIEQRTGIRSRSKAKAEENINTMSMEAVRNALPKLPYDITDVDLIVSASYSPYDTVATAAHLAQHEFHIENAKALYLDLLKALFVFLVSGWTAGFLSLCGGLLSLLVMWMLYYKLPFRPTWFILSVCGALSHNIGQLLGAGLILSSAMSLYYAPVMLVLGLVMGALTSLTLRAILPALGRLGYNTREKR